MMGNNKLFLGQEQDQMGQIRFGHIQGQWSSRLTPEVNGKLKSNAYTRLFIQRRNELEEAHMRKNKFLGEEIVCKLSLFYN